MILKTEFYTIMDRAIAIKRDKYQRWPVHVVAQAGKVFHKSGELMKAASEYKYEKAEGLEQSKEQHDAMETLCLETIATCLRFLEKRRPFSHPDLPAVQPDPETQQAIDYPSPLETTEGMDHYIKHLGVPDEVGRFTTEDVRDLQSSWQETQLKMGEGFVPTIHHKPLPSIEGAFKDSPFPGNQDFIKAFQTGNIETVAGPGLKVVETDSDLIISTQDDPTAEGIWERAVEEHAKTMETPFPDVLNEITPEQLEQAALLLDEPDHTFTEKTHE